jgi:hypothetical protein
LTIDAGRIGGGELEREIEDEIVFGKKRMCFYGG